VTPTPHLLFVVGMLWNRRSKKLWVYRKTFH